MFIDVDGNNGWTAGVDKQLAFGGYQMPSGINLRTSIGDAGVQTPCYKFRGTESIASGTIPIFR